MTNTSQTILENTAASPRKTSKNNLLAILFFIIGAPHIYAIMQKGIITRHSIRPSSSRLSMSAQLSNSGNILSANTSRSFFSPYLTLILTGAIVAGIIELFIF